MPAPTTILTKKLKDGSPCTVNIEPHGELDYQLRVYRAHTEVGITRARPHQLPRTQKGISHALIVIPGEEGVAIGLTSREAEDLNGAIQYFLTQRRKAADAKREQEQAALSAQLRAAVPDAEVWTISDPYGVPGVGKTQRIGGKIVTGLKAWRKYYREDGLCFGAAEDAGYVYFAEVREATEEEAAPVLAQEEAQRRWEYLKSRIKAEIVTPAQRPDCADEEIPDLLDLPEVKFGEQLTHLRVDRAGGTVWVLHFNGYDGDNWSYNNYTSYIAKAAPLTPERTELLDQLAGVKAVS